MFEKHSRFIKYCISGGTAFAIETGLFYVLPKAFHVPLLVANAIALLTSAAVGFVMNKLWSFQSKKWRALQIVEYGLLLLFNIWASDGMIYAMMSWMGLNKYLAKLISMAFIISWNFFLYNKVIFKEGKAVHGRTEA
jgi:putative flippase GtrA